VLDEIVIVRRAHVTRADLLPKAYLRVDLVLLEHLERVLEMGEVGVDLLLVDAPGRHGLEADQRLDPELLDGLELGVERRRELALLEVDLPAPTLRAGLGVPLLQCPGPGRSALEREQVERATDPGGAVRDRDRRTQGLCRGELTTGEDAGRATGAKGRAALPSRCQRRGIRRS
jgi:hypothetical protein